MLKVLVQRAGHMVVVFWLFLTSLFFLIHAAPGGPEQQLAQNPNLPPEAREILVKQLGLDKSLPEQYLSYMVNFFKGDLGTSFSNYPRPVLDIVMERMPRTVMLFVLATLLAYVIGFAVGKLLAWRRGGVFEYATTITGVLLYTIFLPWFALLLIWYFGFYLDWFPIRGFLTAGLWRDSPYEANSVFWRLIVSAVVFLALFVAVRIFASKLDSFRMQKLAVWGGIAGAAALIALYWSLSPMRDYAFDIVHHTVLPIITLSLVNFGSVMLLTRTSLLETMREDYILTARAKGLPPGVIRDRHAARNALLPVVTSLVIALAFVISGGVVTETVFSWPGLGMTIITAVQTGDVPLALGAFTFLGILALAGHLVADIVYTYLDPRIRY
jgi:peptide/nickel transport system permease protein